MHRYFKCNSPPLMIIVDRYIQQLQDIAEEDLLLDDDIWEYDACLNTFGDEDDLNEVLTTEESTEIPKCLADLFEALAGAIFIDAHFCMTTVWNVYYEMMKSLIDKFSKSIPKSPIRQLLEAFQGEIRYSSVERIPDGRAKVILKLDKGNGEHMQFRGIARTRKLARTAAAQNALRHLQAFNKSKMTYQQRPSEINCGLNVIGMQETMRKVAKLGKPSDSNNREEVNTKAANYLRDLCKHFLALNDTNLPAIAHPFTKSLDKLFYIHSACFFNQINIDWILAVRRIMQQIGSDNAVDLQILATFLKHVCDNCNKENNSLPDNGYWMQKKFALFEWNPEMFTNFLNTNSTHIAAIHLWSACVFIFGAVLQRSIRSNKLIKEFLRYSTEIVVNRHVGLDSVRILLLTSWKRLCQYIQSNEMYGFDLLTNFQLMIPFIKKESIFNDNTIVDVTKIYVKCWIQACQQFESADTIQQISDCRVNYCEFISSISESGIRIMNIIQKHSFRRLQKLVDDRVRGMFRIFSDTYSPNNIFSIWIQPWINVLSKLQNDRSDNSFLQCIVNFISTCPNEVLEYKLKDPTINCCCLAGLLYQCNYNDQCEHKSNQALLMRMIEIIMKCHSCFEMLLNQIDESLTKYFIVWSLITNKLSQDQCHGNQSLPLSIMKKLISNSIRYNTGDHEFNKAVHSQVYISISERYLSTTSVAENINHVTADKQAFRHFLLNQLCLHISNASVVKQTWSGGSLFILELMKCLQLSIETPTSICCHSRQTNSSLATTITNYDNQMKNTQYQQTPLDEIIDMVLKVCQLTIKYFKDVVGNCANTVLTFLNDNLLIMKLLSIVCKIYDDALQRFTFQSPRCMLICQQACNLCSIAYNVIYTRSQLKNHRNRRMVDSELCTLFERVTYCAEEFAYCRTSKVIEAMHKLRWTKNHLSESSGYKDIDTSMQIRATILHRRYCGSRSCPYIHRNADLADTNQSETENLVFSLNDVQEEDEYSIGTYESRPPPPIILYKRPADNHRSEVVSEKSTKHEKPSSNDVNNRIQVKDIIPKCIFDLSSTESTKDANSSNETIIESLTDKQVDKYNDISGLGFLYPFQPGLVERKYKLSYGDKLVLKGGRLKDITR
ncbi:hypothetical protein GJ496_011998 [Pomphorhynchus laevis]|nr:hypothetical protein GJ496_011998 [Pomphorhynchus laevis]